MKTKLIILLMLCTWVMSCTDDNVVNNESSERNLSHTDNLFEKKKQFAIALSNVLENHKDVRLLIKEEACKQIDFDYDVLYIMVKDIPLENGNTLKGYLNNLLKEDILDDLENEIPTLTIYVPDLLDGFSALTWDVDQQVPEVAVNIKNNNNVVIYNSKGEEDIVTGDLIPNFPVVVVKENNKIVTNPDRVINNDLTRSSGILPSGLYFLDSALDNTRNIKARTNSDFKYTNSPTDADISSWDTAYDTFGSTSEYWQRDNIYYGLTKTNQRGYFNYNISEHIVGFEVADPSKAMDAYNIISDQSGDPKLNTNWIGQSSRPKDPHPNYPFWSVGNFIFLVKFYVANTGGPASEIQKIFTVSPLDLFEMRMESSKLLDYNKIHSRRGR